MCIGKIEIGSLENAELCAVIHSGLSAKTANGEAAFLAIVDSNGKVIEYGDQVGIEALNVSIACYKNFLIGKGHLKVHTQPPGLKFEERKAA